MKLAMTLLYSLPIQLQSERTIYQILRKVTMCHNLLLMTRQESSDFHESFILAKAFQMLPALYPKKWQRIIQLHFKEVAYHSEIKIVLF